MFYEIMFAMFIIMAVIYTVTLLIIIHDRKLLCSDRVDGTYITICITLPVITIVIVKMANMCWQLI